MNRKVSIFLLLFSVLLLSACQQDDSMTTQDFLNPPQVNGKMDGIWSSENDELTIDQYFYEDNNFISIIQNPEEETWCSLGQWSWNENALTLKISKEYKYDPANSKWEEIEVRDDVLGGRIIDKSSFSEITDDDKYQALVILPDGNEKDFEFQRGVANFSIPAGNELKEIVDEFLSSKTE